MKKMFAAVVLTAALAVAGAAAPALAAKPVPASSSATAAVPTVKYNINRYVDKLNTWQVDNPTSAQIYATLEIKNDETGAITLSNFYVSQASSWGGKNIVQPTPRNPGETATLIVNGVRLNTAVASEWDALFQSWEKPNGYINIVTGETAPQPN